LGKSQEPSRYKKEIDPKSTPQFGLVAETITAMRTAEAKRRYSILTLRNEVIAAEKAFSLTVHE
jgi:hypothetical protein